MCQNDGADRDGYRESQAQPIDKKPVIDLYRRLFGYQSSINRQNHLNRSDREGRGTSDDD